MAYESILVRHEARHVTIEMNRPERRNALSLALMRELTEAFRAVGRSDATGVVLAGNGPVFCAGHDIAEMVGAGLAEMRSLLQQCIDLIDAIQGIPQVVVARVQGLATAAGCQLVASCDLAVAADSATFALPGGKGGWFCHTPLVAVARCMSRKHALEMALTGDPIDAATAASWGLVNRVVALPDLEAQTLELLGRATRGSAFSSGIGKHCFYTQIDLDQPKAYAHALEVMAGSSQTHDAQERMRSFVEKRAPRLIGR